MIKRILNKMMGSSTVKPVQEQQVSDVVRYNDPTPKGFIKDSQLPSSVFELDAIIFNCGPNPKNPNEFMVLIKPLKTGVRT